MKSTIFKPFMLIIFGILSLNGAAQCPTINSLNVSMGANGTATINPVLSSSVSVGTKYYWQVSPSGSPTTSVYQLQGEFIFPTNGVYNVCLNFNDTITGCSSNQACTTLTVTSLTTASCNASFNSYTDSNCVTRFVNTSTGNNMTYGWTINGSYYTSTSPNVNLPNGNYTVLLETFYASQPCDSVYQNITVGCSGTNTVSCVADFTAFTDSTCTTYLTNTSTGSNLTYEWYDITNNPLLVSTVANPTLSLSQGYHVFQLATYSNGTFCDSASNYVYVNCSNPSSSCIASSYFVITLDSINPLSGQYYAYNLSSVSGTATYLWDFGDGTTSSQMYPTHQYAVPGQYVVCLTVNGSYTSALGTATCSGIHCDSSSVQKMAAGFQMGQLTILAPTTVTGVKQLESLSSLKVYPNPFADELIIDIGIENKDLSFTLLNALGEIVLNGNIGVEKATLKTDILQKGFYSLMVSDKTGNTIKTIKLVK